MGRFQTLLVFATVPVILAATLAEVGADGVVLSPEATPAVQGDPSADNRVKGLAIVQAGKGSHKWRDVQEDERQNSLAESDREEDQRQDSLVRKELATLSAGTGQKKNKLVSNVNVTRATVRRCYVCGDPHMFGFDIDGTPWHKQVQFVNRYIDYWLVKSEKIWIQGRGNSNGGAALTKGFAVGGTFIGPEDHVPNDVVLEALGADHAPGKPHQVKLKWKGVWQDIYNKIKNTWVSWNDKKGEVLKANCHGGGRCDFIFRGGENAGGVKAVLGSPTSTCPSIDIHMKCPDVNNPVDGWCGNCNRQEADDKESRLGERGFYPDDYGKLTETSSPPRLFSDPLRFSWRSSGFYARLPNDGKMNLIKGRQGYSAECLKDIKKKDELCELEKPTDVDDCLIKHCEKVSQNGQICQGLHSEADQVCRQGGAGPTGSQAQVAAYELCLYDFCLSQDKNVGDSVAEEVKEMEADNAAGER